MLFYPPEGRGFAAGESNLGNTAGSSGLTGTRLILVGTAGVSLSQSTDASGGTLSISAQTAPVIGTNVNSVATANSTGTALRYAPEDHRHEGLYAGGVSTGGNSSGNTTVQPGRIVFAGGNNITLSVGTAANGLQTITISAANETQTVPPIGTNVNSVATANSTGTITRFAPEDHRHEGVYAVGVSTGGNTAGNTTVQAGRLVLAGGDNITLSVGTAANGLQTVTISAASGGGGLTNIRVSAGTTSNLLSAVTFADGNGVSFGINASTVTASVAAQSVESQSIGASNLGNTSGTSGVASGGQVRYVLVASNGMIGSQSVNGASGTLSIINSWSTATTVSSVATANAVGANNGRFALEAHEHAGVYAAGVSTGGNTSGNTTVQAGRLVLAGGNNITLSVGTAANALQTVTISAPNQSAESQSIGASNLGNTSGTSGVASGAQVLYVLAASNGIIGSQSVNGASGTLSIINSWSTATTVSSVESANVIGANAGRFALEGHQHGGIFAAGVSTGGNTSGNTTVQAGRLVLAGGNNITLSVGTAAGGLQTVTISAPNLGAGAFSGGLSTAGNTAGSTGVTGTRVMFVASDGMIGSQSTDANGGTLSFINSWSTATTVDPIASANNVGPNVGRFANEGHDHAGVPAIAAGSNTGNTSGDTASKFGTWVIAASNNVTVRGSTGAAGVNTAWLSAGGTNSFFQFVQQDNTAYATLGQGSLWFWPVQVQEFVSVSRLQHLASVSHSSSADTRTLQITVGGSFGVYTRNVSTLSLASSGGTSWVITISSQDSTASFSGVRLLTFPVNLSMTPGDYWLAYVNTTSSSRQAAGGNSMAFSYYRAAAAANSFGLFSAALNNTVHLQFGMGVFSATTNAIPNSASYAAITGSLALMPIVYGANATA